MQISDIPRTDKSSATIVMMSSDLLPPSYMEKDSLNLNLRGDMAQKKFFSSSGTTLLLGFYYLRAANVS